MADGLSTTEILLQSLSRCDWTLPSHRLGDVQPRPHSANIFPPIEKKLHTWEPTQEDPPPAERLTDLDVGLLVGWHLSEAERRHVAPQAEGLGDASAGVAGVDQVCREREQPGGRQVHVKLARPDGAFRPLISLECPRESHNTLDG